MSDIHQKVATELSESELGTVLQAALSAFSLYPDEYGEHLNISDEEIAILRQKLNLVLEGH